MDIGVLRMWYEQGKSEQLLAACRSEEQPPEALFFISAALIDLGREDEARERIEAGLLYIEDKVLEADFLALLAFLQARRGNFSGYLEGAQRAVQLTPTPLTLYHWGLASPDPDASLEALHSALKLAEEKGDRHAATRNAFALGVPLLRLGRYREALHRLHYGEMRCHHEGLRTALLYTRACVQILLGETEGLGAELQRSLEEKHSLHPWVCEPLSTTLADLFQTQGRHEEALAVYRHWLIEAPRSYWPRLAHGAVRSLVTLNRSEEACVIARTALTVANDSPSNQATAQLAMGVALWPEHAAKHYLEEALKAFAKSAVPLATEAALHLAALYSLDDNHFKTHNILSQTHLKDLGLSGVRLLGGRALEVIKPVLEEASAYKAFLLGRAEIFREGRFTALRPRGLEILTLLLAHPQGLSGMSLNDAVYGEEADGALRVELYRLKKALEVDIEPSPYRLTTRLESDYQEVETLLGSAQVREAVRHYRGPLLPQSQAPGIVNLRTVLETQLIEAVLSSGDAECAWELAQVMTDDLRLWESLLQLLQADPRLYTVKARVSQLRRELE